MIITVIVNKLLSRPSITFGMESTVLSVCVQSACRPCVYVNIPIHKWQMCVYICLTSINITNIFKRELRLQYCKKEETIILTYHLSFKNMVKLSSSDM